MSEKLTDPREKRWARVHIAVVSLFYLAILTHQLNFYLWDSLDQTYYPVFVAVVAAFTLYFRGFRDVLEIRLLILFWFWYFISRLLNGVSALVTDHWGVLNFSLYFAVAVIGFLLKPEQRMKYLTGLGVCISAYFTVLGLISIYAAIFRLYIVNPITQATLAYVSSAKFSRLNLLDLNPNTSGMWFFIGFSPLLPLFFSCKKKLWRIPIVLAALVNYLGLALTYSRNTMMAFSCCMAMLVILVIINRFSLRKLWARGLVVAVACAVCIPLVYKSFGLATDMLAKISSSAQAGRDTAALFTDPRDFASSLSNLSLRGPIFKSAFITMLREPSRLIRGCVTSDVMSVADQILPKHYPTMHNSYLEAMVLTGLPGLGLAVAFTVLLVERMIRLFFSTDPRLSMAVKVLTIPLAGIFMYSMMEAQIFFNTEFSALYFYLLAGMVLAWSYEVCPRAIPRCSTAAPRPANRPR